MNQVVGGIIGATVTLVALYLFLANAEESSKVIGSLSGGYVDIVSALQGNAGSRVRRV